MRFDISFAFTGAAVALVTVAQMAQGSEPHVNVPTSQQALPGDYFDLPQSAQLRVPLGPPPGPNIRPSGTEHPPVPKMGPSLAVKAAMAAQDSCSADGYTIAVAVTDAAGNLKAALAPEGTRPNGVFMAMHKAVAVVGLGMSTLNFRQKVEGDASLMARVKPNMALLPGGIPIVKDGQIIGAIATSGASAHEEEKCAQDGIASIRNDLVNFR